MLKYGGYAGRILRVDLGRGTTSIEPLRESLIEQYLGGNGFGVHFLYDEVPPRVDALGPENKVILAVGPVQGTAVPAVNARTAIITKSPLTNRFLDSYFGGDFGAKLKYAGYDVVIIEGQSSCPVYLWIDNDHVELRDASDLWGLNTYATQMKLVDLHQDPDIATLTIGRAGERQVRIACTISGVHAAGRGGTGAVLGAKNLKAIAVRGSKDVRVPDIVALEDYVSKLMARIKAHPGTGQGLPTYGTAATITANNKLGMLGTRNWQEEVFEGADRITGTVLRQEAFIKDDACFGCPIACGKLTMAKKGEYKGTITVGPEYETLWSLGSNCGIDNLEAIIRGDRLCDEYGIDSISAGATIAMAMECFDKGLLTLEDTGGLEVRFGNYVVMLDLIEQIGERRGLGALLGEGTARMAQQIGKEAEKFAVHVKGLEVPAHSARGVPGMAVGYATSNRGGTHQDGRPTAERAGVVDINQIDGKGYYEVDVQRMTTLSDCLIHCRMMENIMGLTALSEDHTEIVRLVTGLTLTLKDLTDIADRVYAMERAFNIREGESRSSDTLPWRFMHEPIPSGPAAGKYIPPEVLDKLLDETYEKRGWDKKTGYPTKETLHRLGLDSVIKDIYGS
ncbi:MAG TPA: aldehyde ferredoxin oxidoreductase family protein [Firmicutes bacterium]|nr:aldehyde ferredoxin oxidoreductase family protein [Bacillota bacterium]